MKESKWQEEPILNWQEKLRLFFALIIFLIMTLTTCINLIPLVMYGNPDILNIISGYVGFILLGMACIAIGQLFSSLTENQIIAALMTWPVLLGFWFVGKFKSFQQTAWLRSLSDYLSFSGHYGDFLRGLIRSEGVIFFLAVTTIALVLNTAYMRGRR